ncbi:hypothetical protein QUA44_18290 [Microcoleus sp. N9_A2]|uniref:hypothetical protein n=2 Tax=unclassified Microcoleus TaxID=2642155 RepID=UPI002FD33AB8
MRTLLIAASRNLGSTSDISILGIFSRIGMTQTLFCSTVLSICNLCSYKCYHKNCTETPQPTKYIIASRAVFASESAIALDRDIRAIPHGIASLQGLSAVLVSKLAQISLCRRLTQNAIKSYTINS